MNLRRSLAFGAHPDDIEFGCGGVIARETAAGRTAHFVVCSRGEAGTHGTPKQRIAEAKKAAALLGATIEFIELDGDAHLEIRAAHAIKLAGIIRRVRPASCSRRAWSRTSIPIIARLGKLVRDAARLARYGGLKELRDLPPHAIDQLFFYAVTPEAEPRDISPVLIDVSAPEIIAAWTAAMEAHASQAQRAQLRRTATHPRPAARIARAASSTPSRCFRTIRWCSIRWRRSSRSARRF